MDYYEKTDEAARLQRLESVLKFLRTRDILDRNLPSAPADMIDVDGGPAVNSFWLAGLEYSVHLVDIVPKHIELPEELALHYPNNASLTSLIVGHARQQKFADHSADVVLMLGELYRLVRSSDRLAALYEPFRVLRLGGILIVEAISRYLPLITRTLHTGSTARSPTWISLLPHFFTTPVDSNARWQKPALCQARSLPSKDQCVC